MKKIQTLLMAVLLSVNSYSQITINTGDFATAGDNILISKAAITSSVDITTTGASQTWDFSSMQANAQDTINYLAVSSTATTYALVFVNSGFNPNRANIATEGTDIPTISGAPITISNVFNFYYNSSASYKQIGFGAEINGFATPTIFKNKDVIYNFPLNFMDQDSSNSDYSFSIPGIGYYGHSQKRVNNVDGHGTLLTPYGSFAALRIKSMVSSVDTFALDTLGVGFALEQPLVTEYKWLANNQKVPLLQINTSTIFGIETVTSIVYRDSLRALGVDDIKNTTNDLSIYPNPSQGSFTTKITLDRPARVSVELFDIAGRRISNLFNKHLPEGINTLLLNVNNNSGIYFCKVMIDGKTIGYKKIIVAE